MLKSATKNQKGFAQILVLLLLLVAIPIGIYAVQHPTNILPFAHEKDSSATDQLQLSVSIKSPVDQYATAISNPITIVSTWTGTGVNKVETYLEDQNGTQLYILNSAIDPKGNSLSFNFTFPVKTLPNTYKLKTTVGDSSGNKADSAEVTIQLTEWDKNPPSVSLSAPGKVVSCSPDQPCATPSPAPSITITQGKKINLTAHYSDDSGVNKIQLYRDDGKIKSQVGPDIKISTPTGTSNKPLAYPITGDQLVSDTSNPVLGSYTYTVKAIDKFNNVTESNGFPVTVTDNPPTVTTSITNPSGLSSGSSVSKGTILQFKITYSDDIKLTKVEYLRDEVVVQTHTVLPAIGLTPQDNTALLALGSHSYTAKAYDSLNQVTESTPIQITLIDDIIKPDAPVVTSPKNTSSSAPFEVKKGVSLTINMNLKDDVGVTEVDCANEQGTKISGKLAGIGATLGNSSQCTFTPSNTMAPGDHYVSITAQDAAKNVSDAAKVYIRVTK